MKESWKQRIENCFFRIYSSMEKNSLLNSVKQGFVLVMPIFVIGGFVLLLMNIPVSAVNQFIRTVCDARLFQALNIFYDVTFGCAGLYVVLAVSYKFSIYKFGQRHASINIISSVVAMMSYMALVGWRVFTLDDPSAVPDVMFRYLNVNNVFIALLTAVGATELFFITYRGFDRATHNIYLGGDKEFSAAIKAIFPMIGTVSAFVVVTLLVNLLGFVNLQELIVAGLTFPFRSLGTGLDSALLIVFLQTFLWFFGIHGSNVFESTNDLIFVGATEGISKSFLDTFVLMGGCGSSICLLVALLLFSRSKRNKITSRSAAVPMLFGINEILVFGLPIVLNPVLFIPFLAAPVVLLFTSYAALSLGIVPRVPAMEFRWTTPIFASGYMFSSGADGLLLQLFNIVLGMLIYLPFVKLNDKLQRRKFSANIREMTAYLQAKELQAETVEFFSMTNHLYGTAGEFAQLLRHDIDYGAITLFYQPLVSAEGRVIGAEALLRWGADTEEYFYPPLVVSIAKEDGTFDMLTKRIVTEVLDDLVSLNRDREEKISLSVNLQIGQLINEAFTDWLISEVHKREIGEKLFLLEITEESRLNERYELTALFDKLKANNIEVSLDDFSMGQTSISYLQQNFFSHVKLDGSITKKMMNNQRSQDIVKSIIDLGKSLGFEVVAEYVETSEQRDLLKKMGCYIYQGWLYSPAIPFEAFEAYVNKINRKGEGATENQPLAVFS